MVSDWFHGDEGLIDGWWLKNPMEKQIKNVPNHQPDGH
jgi:hypothetical protein